jgi:hemerythrin-like metal-binding protein
MAFMNWGTGFSVGVQAIDEEHQEMIALVNQVHDHLCSSTPDEDLKKAFERLSSYTVTHFWNEERLFLPTAYPRAAIHARKHKHLLTILGCFQSCIDRTGRYFKLEEQLDFLREWMMDHITTEDAWVGAYLTHQEAPPPVSELGNRRDGVSVPAPEINHRSTIRA